MAKGARRHKKALTSKRSLEAAFSELDLVREPLFEELTCLLEDPNYLKGQPAHLCCTRQRNQMRISPLEAEAIARAFRENAALRARLPGVLERLRKELEKVEESTRRQNFDCPLLEGTRCLVHETAKPIGCTAWNPGRDFTETGWSVFEARDELSDWYFGPHWKLRVIPLWLKRVFADELRRDDGTQIG